MMKPSPGSDEALDAGCTCPVMENAHGRGAVGTWAKPDGEKVFIMQAGCPLHGIPMLDALLDAVGATKKEEGADED